jgi:hypothetical protein
LTVVEADQPAKTRSEKSASGYGGKKQDKRQNHGNPRGRPSQLTAIAGLRPVFTRNPNTQARLMQDFVA